MDLDRNTDSDGDGIENNDVDATGETVEWQESACRSMGRQAHRYR